jgi:hypothetical protein
MFAIYPLIPLRARTCNSGVIALKAVPRQALTATNLLLFIPGVVHGYGRVRQYFPLALFVVYWISRAFVVRSADVVKLWVLFC